MKIPSTPAEWRDVALAVRDFIYQDTLTVVAVIAGIFIIFWIMMKDALGLDDRVWNIMTFTMVVIIFISLLILLDNGTINVDFGAMWESIKSLF